MRKEGKKKVSGVQREGESEKLLKAKRDLNA